MAEKKVEVFYQAPGKSKWERVEQVRVREKVRTVRESARALLAEADASAARLLFVTRPVVGLKPEEVFERQMAKALGAWGRFMEVEIRRFSRAADAALEDLLGKKH
jgi:hypothetical protein